MILIKSPVGLRGRAIVSSFIRKVRDGKKQPKKCTFKCIKTCDISKSPCCIIIALVNAFKGNFENGFAFAGSKSVLLLPPWGNPELSGGEGVLSEN